MKAAKNVETKEERQVFILFSHSLMAEGLNILLRAHDLKVVGVDARQADAVEHAQHLMRPQDVIIVDEGDIAVHPSMSIFQLFMKHPDVTVVGLNVKNNSMEIYQREVKTMERLEDLLGILQCPSRSGAQMLAGE
ncbi:MAG: hypothetical protein HYU86_10235 [Chloroflexi bacterium]|nr:hypothetical protein [Chloroflexota bacterium]